MKTSLAVLLLLISAAVGSNEIYFREDPSGLRHYSDQPAPDARRITVQAGRSYRRVKRVFDGDTILLDDRKRVRLSGINTPEIESARKRGEPGGEEAKAWLKKAIEGKKIYLERDLERHDRYRRILAHVFTEDGTHINQRLVALGLATVNIHPPNLKYAQRLLDAQRQAEAGRLGIWGDPAYQPRPVSTLTGSKRNGWQRLVGKVRSLKTNRKFYRLIYSENVDVRIPRVHLDLFPDLNRFLGRETEIRGWPSRRKEHYSILVQHPSALLLLEKG